MQARCETVQVEVNGHIAVIMLQVEAQAAAGFLGPNFEYHSAADGMDGVVDALFGA